MPPWWGKKSKSVRKKEEHQTPSIDWKRYEKSKSLNEKSKSFIEVSTWNLANNRGTEAGYGFSVNSDGVLEKRDHPLPPPTGFARDHEAVAWSASSTSSSGSSDIDPPDYRYSDAVILARGRSLKSSSLRQQHSGTTFTPTGNASCSPKASREIKFNPRSRSPTPSPVSKVQTNQPSPIHPRGCGYSPEAFRERQDDRKNQGHPLPLPPSPPNSPPKHLLRNNSANEGVLCLHSRWKKGKLLGRGTFGHVYAGFNSVNGQMCAIKEVRVISDDKNSNECLRQLNQEITLLSRLSHPNIVQYYGSELNDSTLSVYLEYVSGGSIHKLLQEYGPFKEPVIQSYTGQILSGLAYLHGRKTVHRDIKGANILVDPNGEIKLVDFGMAKHITPSSYVLSFKGSPYWMAPEVIMNHNGYNLAVDIWSLGCTILEMATSKPPWSQFEGVAAIFKIGNSKEIPPIPDHFSEDGKDFLKLCLQRDPSARPTAAQLLEHPFVRDQATVKLTKINSIRDAMQFNTDISYMQNKTEVHSYQKITPCDVDYGIRILGGLPTDFKTSSNQVGARMNPSLPVSPSSSPLRLSEPTHMHCLLSPPHPTYLVGMDGYGLTNHSNSPIQMKANLVMKPTANHPDTSPLNVQTPSGSPRV
ncbi:mitogen-activated protein kinase kinase kinase YODA [Cinnamomum micranthum f. kanehirae]|uniref:mitogen-activated protein kinase kinase kinase n=1 Tax=Cinnamomum micranthum f. kanehirae TaxID=337451 RepID=A0A3S4PNF1_9MAGN|nr:mitogen-activated protein kinase kinase kinase YODA [Cinnamomum micranthum f. kanehirae]